MPTISPTPIGVHHSLTQQFTGAGITSPVWTLYGPGTLTQGGLYIAPATGTGDYVVSYHGNSWDGYPGGLFTKNADDSLTKAIGTPGYYGQVTGAARLNSAGDYVEFFAHTVNPYWVGVRNVAGSMEFVYAVNGNAVREYHPSGPLVTSPVFGINAGDLIKVEIIAGGQLRFSVNGVIKYTSVYVYHTNALLFEVDAVANALTVYLPPRYNGPSISNYLHAEAALSVLPDLLLPAEGCELYCEPQTTAGANGSSVATLTDLSGRGRNLTAAGTPQPTLQTNVLGGKSVVRFDGTQQHLRNPAAIPVRCGWIVAKYNGGTFAADHKGLLTDYNWQGILVSNILDGKWYDFAAPGFEFRSDDRIYPSSAAPGPMGQFRIVFFRYWNGPLLCDGIQLGRDRTFTTRLWNGDVALLALYSRDFTEEEVRAHTQKIAANFGMTSMADVYPYQADVSDTAETPLQTVNVYDPPDGGARIVEVLDTPKRLLNLKFSVAGEAEARAMKKFHRDHYPEVPCIYRDYRFTPPEDIEGYINSPYELEGSTGDFQYSFTFREK
jgi:hypothetical protein